MTQITKTQTTNLAEVGENIGLSEGRQLVKSFKQANPNATSGYYIGRNILDQVLAQPGCVGINFRKCLTETNEEHLVYTGVNAQGKDILEFTVVTNAGELVKKEGIVADKSWIERDLADDAIHTIFDI
ncbi:MAG: hypothetical protein ABIN97_15165 [Ginsengibacter sp.]